ncbi:ribbon-helix-helix protein, CopG family [Fumia xinanensis]|uniref:CopG family transcriptional regulator n=1 Tax=Fumia xinanensis TaxID=2763659 RepID=A0A926E468_9FIRM|nr:ribbon-helix-helix protein, CopG family [Fumia xinanensis]MBC8559824.1 CopG family transcriptional regulator [Fumia xinanensis]
MKNFKILPRPQRPPHTCRTIYLSKELADQIDLARKKLECSFSAFAREALRYALDALDEAKQQKNGQP